MNKYPVIILVGPQLGENIGACARAMKNFCLSDLRIVNPRDGWPNEKAESASVGAIDLIKSAKIYKTIQDASKDLEYLYATTGVKRHMNKPHVLTKNLANSYEHDLKTGILFGRENCGLNNDEISLCNKIITIDTNPEFSSLNIAQAVLVVCYELFKQIERTDLTSQQEFATKEELGFFYNHLFEILEKKNFFKLQEKKIQMQRNIVNIFSRIDKLSKNEIQTLRGILKTLE